MRSVLRPSAGPKNRTRETMVATFKTGGSDGTRTRGLRRDRPSNSENVSMVVPTFCAPELTGKGPSVGTREANPKLTSFVAPRNGCRVPSMTTQHLPSAYALAIEADLAALVQNTVDRSGLLYPPNRRLKSPPRLRC